FLNNQVLTVFTRHQLLLKLQLSFTEFSGLDSVTLSRWSTGKTTPSFYRQLLIAHVANKIDVYLSWEKLEKTAFTSNKSYLDYTSQFNNPYSSIMNIKKKYTINYSFKKNYKCREIYHYALKIKSIRELSSRLDNNKYYLDVNVFHISSNSGSESVIYFYDDCKYMYNLTNITYLKKNQIYPDNLVWFGLAYQQSSIHFEILAGLAFNHLIRKYAQRAHAIFTVRGKKSMLFFEKIGATRLAIDNQNDEYGKIYLYTIQIKKIFDIAEVKNLVLTSDTLYQELIPNLQTYKASTKNFIN
ncbi:hypothetical protein OH461_13045, partial [Vibrio sp. LaRot3]|nr:hypothetical protein [Vibrio sp. LaRot3]